MSTMISEIYEAFKAANVPDDKSRAAAEAVAKIDQRYIIGDTKIEREIAALRGEVKETRTELKSEIAEVRGELKSIKWLTGGVIAGIGIQIVITLMHLPK